MTSRSPCGVCCRYEASLVIFWRLRDASCSLLRGPMSSCTKCFNCSVLPGRMGKAIASDAMFFSPLGRHKAQPCLWAGTRRSPYACDVCGRIFCCSLIQAYGVGLDMDHFLLPGCLFYVVY